MIYYHYSIYQHSMEEYNKMARVNKIDFYCGAFLSYIISNGANEPTLFEDSEKSSKRLKFSLRNKDYKAYLKYVCTPKTPTLKGKTYTKWDVIFTESERDYLTNSFAEEDRENIVILVCANKEFKDTYFAIVKIDDALKCMANEQPRITIKRQKGSKYVSCYGSGISDENALQLKYNFDEYFDF